MAYLISNLMLGIFQIIRFLCMILDEFEYRSLWMAYDILYCSKLPKLEDTCLVKIVNLMHYVGSYHFRGA